ncbi:MAG: hypothetical protein U0414_39445 [Polyangiaceae bacterium]
MTTWSRRASALVVATAVLAATPARFAIAEPAAAASSSAAPAEAAPAEEAPTRRAYPALVPVGFVLGVLGAATMIAGAITLNASEDKGPGIAVTVVGGTVFTGGIVMAIVGLTVRVPIESTFLPKAAVDVGPTRVGLTFAF